MATVSATAKESFRMDGLLVLRAQAGDARAFELLYERHERRVYHLALGMLHSVEDAEDVTQETFLNAYRALPQLADGQAFHAWTTRIAVNLCRRSRARRRAGDAMLSLDAESTETGLSLQVPDTSPGPQQAVEVGNCVWKCAGQLPGCPMNSAM